MKCQKLNGKFTPEKFHHIDLALNPQLSYSTTSFVRPFLNLCNLFFQDERKTDQVDTSKSATTLLRLGNLDSSWKLENYAHFR